MAALFMSKALFNGCGSFELGILMLFFNNIFYFAVIIEEFIYFHEQLLSTHFSSIACTVPFLFEDCN